MIHGGMLEPQNVAKLKDAQDVLHGLKSLKLAMRRRKYQGTDVGLAEALKYLEGEIKEFKDTKSPQQRLLELADVANCVDLIAMLVLESFNEPEPK